MIKLYFCQYPQKTSFKSQYLGFLRPLDICWDFFHCTKNEVFPEGFLQLFPPNMQFPADLVTLSKEMENFVFCAVFLKWISIVFLLYDSLISCKKIEQPDEQLLQSCVQTDELTNGRTYEHSLIYTTLLLNQVSSDSYFLRF